MNRNSFFFVTLAGSLAICSFVYFIGLILDLPFTLTALLAAVSIILSIKTLKNKIVFPDDQRDKYFLKSIVLMAAFIFIGYKSVLLAEKWGAWDAWGIWDLHARFIASGRDWQNMFHPAFTASHPDYPLMLPGMIAFGSGSFKDYFLMIPYAIGLLFTLSIVGLIYAEIVQKNLGAGILTIAAFVFSEYYIRQGVSQYADILLAFYCLGTMVALYHYEQSAKPAFIGLATFFMACCLWTKNEGIVFALFAGILFAKDLLKRKNLPVVLVASAAPALVWLLFKLCYAPPNDLLHQQNSSWLDYLGNSARYTMIIDSFWGNLKQRFPELLIALSVLFISSFFIKKWANRKFIILILTVIFSQISYVITPYGLDWHLATSQDRLILHVFPAFVFIAGINMAAVLNKYSTSRTY